MATLTVWRYETPLGAGAGAVRLGKLQDREALEVHDAVAVTWMRGVHQPRVARLRHSRGDDHDGASVLAALVRLLVASEAEGAPGVGAADVALRLRGTGVDSDLLHALAEHLSPGRSALLVLSGEADLDVVRPVVERGLARGDLTLLHVELPPGATDLLREALDAPHGEA